MSNKTGQGTRKKIGRPTKYTPELGDEIAGRIAEGESLLSICADDHMPVPKIVYSWLRLYEDFCNNYTRAREDQADTYADQIVMLADAAFDSDSASAARVKVDARKWVAMKLKPKKYGDKLDMTSDGKALPQPILAMLTTQNAENSRKVITNDVINGEESDETSTRPQISTPENSGNIMDDINQ